MPRLIPVNVGWKNCVEWAVLPPVVTLMGPYAALDGTSTVSCVDVAAVTDASIPPMNTVLLAGVVSNPVPVMLTEAPTAAEVGVNEAIVGAAAAAWFRYT